MNKNRTSKIISIVIFGLAVLGLAYLIFKEYILADCLVGIFVQVGAVGLMIWARITFGIRSFHATANTTKGELVTKGPYRLLRHPIYAAVIYFVWAGVLCYRFVDAILVAVLISACMIGRMLLEEKFLMVTYVQYREYCKRTFRLIPFIF
jgi:protein-S-isoprenylcysteine O-methyltransferase Ste14